MYVWHPGNSWELPVVMYGSRRRIQWARSSVAQRWQRGCIVSPLMEWDLPADKHHSELLGWTGDCHVREGSMFGTFENVQLVFNKGFCYLLQGGNWIQFGSGMSQAVQLGFQEVGGRREEIALFWFRLWDLSISLGFSAFFTVPSTTTKSV